MEEDVLGQAIREPEYPTTHVEMPNFEDVFVK